MKPFFNEVDVDIDDGETLHLVLDFRAIDIIESLTQESMDAILPQLLSPSHSLAAKVIWAMLRERHDSITLNEAMGVVVDRKIGPKVGMAMADLLSKAYNLDEVKDKNPRKRRGQSQSSEKSG